MDKMFSLEKLEYLLSEEHLDDYAEDFCRQLIDTLHENERLRALCAYHELRNKESDNG